jgi:hypothetical protein
VGHRIHTNALSGNENRQAILAELRFRCRQSLHSGTYATPHSSVIRPRAELFRTPNGLIEAIASCWRLKIFCVYSTYFGTLSQRDMYSSSASRCSVRNSFALQNELALNLILFVGFVEVGVTLNPFAPHPSIHLL